MKGRYNQLDTMTTGIPKAFTGDYMVRAAAADNQVRAFALTSLDLVEAARIAHNTAPTASAALGRTLSGALMMNQALVKQEDGLLTVRFDGDGPIGTILATADHNGNVKGYVQNPGTDLPRKSDRHLDVGSAVGHGTLTVLRDLDGGNTYNGQVLIHSGEIADDLTHYFVESEQIPTSVGLGVLVSPDGSIRRSGGFLLQLMPFADEAVISRLEENLGQLRSVTQMLEDEMAPEDLLSEILRGLNPEWTDRLPVRFHCNCTADRVERALMLLGAQELDGMLAENRDFEISCHFCGKKYLFTPDDLQRIRAGI